MENCNFPSFSVFYYFVSFFITFASSGAKIFQKMENCNFPRVFFMFFHFLIIFLFLFFIFHHFCFQWCKNFPKMENCNFPRVFSFFLSFFYHVSSFLLPVVQKFSTKWKIAIFLGVFMCFFKILFLSCFIIFAPLEAKMMKNYNK